MHSTKEKVSNAASAAKAHVEAYKAKLEEKAEKATARTQEEKDIAHERRKAKEAEAKMNLHLEKAEHAAEKLHGKHHFTGHQQPVGKKGLTTGTTTGAAQYDQQPAGTVDQTTGTAAPAPAYPLGGRHNKHL